MNQNTLLIVVGVIAVVVIAGCVTLMVMGHNADAQNLVQIGIAVIGAVVAAMVRNAHEANVTNQAKIAEQVGVNLDAPPAGTNGAKK